MRIFFLLIALASYCLLSAQDTSNQQMLWQSEPAVTEHSVRINGQEIPYTATAGYLPMTDESGKLRAQVFFVAYTRRNVSNPEQRPLTFTFNGGPGSSSVWLHMGALGPRRILMTDEGGAMAPPYQIVDNEYSWLDQTDLVFIDPMMTGFTRPAEGVDRKEFLGYEEDRELVGDFIRLYTTRYERWASPKFLAGESYGTTRAAGLAGYLQDRHGLYINGLMLISAVLDFSTIRDHHGNDLSPLLRLPTFAATAWYHKQVDPKYDDLEAFLEEVETFTLSDYAVALLQGDALPAAEKQRIVDKLHEYTGLSKEYIEATHLRFYVGPFNKELLRDESKTVGRLDSRFTGIDYNDTGESYEYDPSYNTAIYGPFTTAVNDHLRRTLQYRNDLPYEILTGRARPWNYSNVQNRYLNVAETLRSAMTKNPYLKVWIANGYYDLATPYFATEYVVNHMFLRGGLKDNITMTYYPAGHMMYIHRPSLEVMHRDLRNFMQHALPASRK